MSEPDNKASSCTVCFLFILALLALGAAITVTVLLYVWGYMGFIGTSTLSITNCTYPYHTLKFSDLTLHNKTIFGATAASSFAGILVFCISLRLLVKNCSKDQKRSNETTKCNKMTLYLFICLMMMGTTVQVGYYFTYLLEGSSCTFVAQSTQMLVLLVIGGVALVCELIIFLITVCCLKLQQDSEQKYKFVDTKQTEPNEIHPRRNEYKPSYSTQKRREYQPRFREQEDTKQYIFESPSRKPLDRMPERNAVFVNKTYNTNPNDMEMRFVPRKKEENPVFNLHPRLATDGVDQILNAKNDRSGNRDFQEDDQRYLREARRNYMNDQNNRTPMLRTHQPAYQRYDGTVQRRRNRNDDPRRPPRREDRYRDDDDSYDDRDSRPNQYFRDTQPPRRRIESPLRMRNRQQSRYL